MCLPSQECCNVLYNTAPHSRKCRMSTESLYSTLVILQAAVNNQFSPQMQLKGLAGTSASACIESRQPLWHAL